MLHTHRHIYRLMALLMILATLCFAGCGKSSENNETAAGPDSTSAPTNPIFPSGTDAPTNPPITPDTPTAPNNPTDPIHLPGYHYLYDYLVSKGNVTVKEATYTFTMRTDNESILLEYKNDTTSVAVTLRNATTTHTVAIAFDVYTATAELDATTYSNADRTLNKFYCNTPSMASSLKSLATSAVWTCMTQTAKMIKLSGITMADLGFTNYE